MTKVISKIVTRWSNSGMIDKSNEDIYVYGLDLLIFTILNISVIIVVSFIFNRFPETFILLLIIIPLQAYGGGYHAKTHLRCFLIMFIGWNMLLMILPFITPILSIIINILSLIIIWFLAPVPHVNVKMSPDHKMKLRNIVRMIAFIISLTSLLFMFIIPELTRHSIIISTGLCVVALSMIFALIFNKFRY